MMAIRRLNFMASQAAVRSSAAPESRNFIPGGNFSPYKGPMTPPRTDG